MKAPTTKKMDAPADLLPREAFGTFLKLSSGCTIGDAPQNPDWELVNGQIRRCLTVSSGGFPTELLHSLWHSVEVAVHLGRASERQWRLAGIIWEAMRAEHACLHLSKREQWKEALAYAAELAGSDKSRGGPSHNTRESVVATAFKDLANRGYTFDVDSYGAHLSATSYREICVKIEKHISRVGGLNFANFLLKFMASSGRMINGSLIAARQPRHVYGVAAAGTPLHFLYVLSLKHLSTSGRFPVPSKDLEKAERLARNFAAALDVEPHSIYENISISALGFEKLLNETVVYDELFSFPQWQPLVSGQLTHLWIKELQGVGCDFPYITADVWALFGRRLQKMSQADQLVYVDVMGVASGPLTSAHAELLLKACSVPVQKIHRRYATPRDSRERVDALFPLIEVGRGSYLLQPKAIVARAFCERLLTLMRNSLEPKGSTSASKKASSKLESKFGTALEGLTRHTLRDIGANVTVANGKYARQKGEELEIDFVVETDERVFLFECKKKALTSHARAGNTLAMMSDLNDSFLSMTAQLARHEAELRRAGTIKFMNGEILELGGRHVEKIAVSLFDHGALQDRSLIMPLFQRLIGHSVSARNPLAEGVAAAMNKKLSIISDSLRVIIEHQVDVSEDRAVFGFSMSTWWLSIDQLAYLCRSGDGLWESLRRLRHLTTQSGDIIWEAHRVAKSGSVAADLFALAEKMNSRVLI